MKITQTNTKTVEFSLADNVASTFPDVAKQCRKWEGDGYQQGKAEFVADPNPNLPGVIRVPFSAP
jgi:hypothetical protein